MMGCGGSLYPWPFGAEGQIVRICYVNWGVCRDLFGLSVEEYDDYAKHARGFA